MKRRQNGKLHDFQCTERFTSGLVSLKRYTALRHIDFLSGFAGGLSMTAKRMKHIRRGGRSIRGVAGELPR